MMTAPSTPANEMSLPYADKADASRSWTVKGSQLRRNTLHLGQATGLDTLQSGMQRPIRARRLHKSSHQHCRQWS